MNDNVIIIGSGGLVHNTNQIERFGGHDKIPNDWAKNFDDFITEELLDTNDNING